MENRKETTAYSSVNCLFRVLTVACLLASVQGCASVPRAAHDGNLRQVTDYLASGKGTAQDKFDDGDCPACSLLHYAAAGGQSAVAKLLLEEGADVNARNGVGLTPLHLACYSGQVEIARLLLANGAVPSLSLRGRYGYTPLIIAAGGVEKKDRTMVLPMPTGAVLVVPVAQEGPQSQEVLVETLLAAGADPNVPSDAGNTALHIAAYRGYLTVVELLLAKGADPTLRNNQGETAEMLAQRFGKGDVVILLQQRSTK